MQVARAQDQPFVVIQDPGPAAVYVEGFVLQARDTVHLQAAIPDLRPGNAWILDGSTREPVWIFSETRQQKREGDLRVVSERIILPAGAYEMYYATSDPRKPFSEWEDIGNLIGSVLGKIFGREDEREEGAIEQAGIRLYGTHGVPESNLDRTAETWLDSAFLTLVGLQNEQFARQGFTLARELEIEIYALGEGADNEMYDYAWILNADTHETVWHLSHSNSRHAGGAENNRLARESVRLPAGNYVAFIVTDPWHATGMWQEMPPYDPDFWGLTLRVKADSLHDQISLFDYEQRLGQLTIAELTEAGNDTDLSKQFTLEHTRTVQVYAFGEAVDETLFDYGWITNTDTGDRVWTMRYDETRFAGGSQKNRYASEILTLPAGSYELHYTSDDSHSFDGWNIPPPFDPPAWGIRLLDQLSASSER